MRPILYRLCAQAEMQSCASLVSPTSVHLSVKRSDVVELTISLILSDYDLDFRVPAVSRPPPGLRNRRVGWASGQVVV